MTAFKDVETLYERLGETQSLWAVMTYPEFRNDENLEKFFESGEVEIDEQLKRLAELKIEYTKGSCLDFGCGVGRLTNAWSPHFEKVTGVDISSTMIAKANEIKKFENVSFILNKNQDLRTIDDESFDFVYSNKTIQHIPYPASKNYIKDFFRILKPGGVALFLVHNCRHSEEGSISFKLSKWHRETVRPFFKKLRGKPPVQIHPISKENISKFVSESGGEILHWETDSSYTRRKKGNLRTWYWTRRNA